MSEVLSSEIQFFGKQVVISCDAKCDKAFGINERLRSPNSLEDDDFEWYADDELGEAPEVSPHTEGGDNKPRSLAEAHNKWCARECERAVLSKPGEVVVLPNFGIRQKNIIES